MQNWTQALVVRLRRPAQHAGFVRFGKLANRRSRAVVFSYPTMFHWLVNRPAIVLPVNKITKVIVKANRIYLYCGPYRVAEIRMMPLSKNAWLASIPCMCPHAFIDVSLPNTRSSLSASHRESDE